MHTVLIHLSHFLVSGMHFLPCFSLADKKRSRFFPPAVFTGGAPAMDIPLPGEIPLPGDPIPLPPSDFSAPPPPMPMGFPGGVPPMPFAHHLNKPPPLPPAFPPPSDDVDVLFQPPTHKEAVLYSPSRVRVDHSYAPYFYGIYFDTVPVGN